MTSARVVWPLVLLGLFSCRGSDKGDPGPEIPMGAGGRGGGRGTAPSPQGGSGASSLPGSEISGGASGRGGAGTPIDAGDPAQDGAVDQSTSTSDVALESAPPAIPPSARDCSRLLAAVGPMSRWAHPDGKGGLTYEPLAGTGDHIMDFSHAGYGGGGVALPVVPVVATLAPSGGDDQAAIQGAIDAVSARPLERGIRGALLLKPGTYQLSGALRISASGVVLRGSGSGAGGTELRFPGLARRVMFVAGGGTRTIDPAVASIADDYVAAGARSFTVDNAAAFQVGDEVVVGRPVTAPWISLLGMDQLVRNGAPQTWITPGTVLRAERTVSAVAGNLVTVDVPIPDSFDGKYVKPPGGSIAKYAFAGRINQVGIESLRFVGSPRAAGNDFHFVQMTAVVDAWIKDVVAHDFTNGVVIADSAKRITIEDTIISHTPGDYFTAAAPADFNIDGGQVLVQRSGSKGGNKIFYFATAGGGVGPNVVLGFAGTGVRSHIQPHQRWATGLLVDSTDLGDGNIEYINRGTAGSGHGWTMGWGVVWNSAAASIKVEQPAGAANWAIGSRGNQFGSGTFDSHGTPVNPASLYLAQLCVRLGPQALVNIGYPK
jgi:hypothetical protein